MDGVLRVVCRGSSYLVEALQHVLSCEERGDECAGSRVAKVAQLGSFQYLLGLVEPVLLGDAVEAVLEVGVVTLRRLGNSAS